MIYLDGKGKEEALKIRLINTDQCLYNMFAFMILFPQFRMQ